MSETQIDRIVTQFGQAALTVIASLNALGPLWPSQAVVNNNDIFDFIIVGSGVGSIVANRLTENKNFNVLLIEAGGDPSLEHILAGLFSETQNSYGDWQYKSTGDPTAVSQDGGDFNLAGGKLLGGTSSINHLLYVRANPEDFIPWAKITNDTQWSYESLLPYYKKVETVYDREILESSTANFHGTDGPIVLTREPHESAKKYLKSFVEVGQQSVLDVNGNDTSGYTQGQFIIGKLFRQSTAFTYLRKAKDRSNLHVLKKALVTKVLFDRNKRAYAVKVLLDNGETITVKASKEVILSAGVFNTPQILQLSGIGNSALLKSLNIPVISDLPAGDNLQDHTAVPIVQAMEYSLEISELPKLTKISFPIIIGNVPYNGSVKPIYQTTNLLLVHDGPYLPTVCGTIFGYKNEYCDTFKLGSVGRNTLFTLLANLHPESRGTVRINTTDPTVPPVITMGFLKDERDVEKFVEFIQDFLQVQKSTYFTNVDADLVDLELSECEDFDYLSSDYWRCFVRYTSCSLYHYTSTCPMGTVVDGNLFVYGVKGLRIVDASVIPFALSANPFATAAMLAEKASDIIKKAYA